MDQQKAELIKKVIKKIDECDDIEKLKIIYDKLVMLTNIPEKGECWGGLLCKMADGCCIICCECKKCIKKSEEQEKLYLSYDLRNITGL